MRTNRTTRAVTATAVGLVLALGATACGADTTDTSSSSSPQRSATEHNDADVSFATDMLQHHAQALSMVELTAGRRLDPAVRALAEEIRSAQAPEIETFIGWLTEWDEPVPETTGESGGTGDMMANESMEDMDMPGMMSADEMTALEAAPDAEFEDMWLEMMIAHHTGAVEMAETEVEKGQYQPAIELAQSIITSQTQEIATMKDLLA